jgi:cellulose synthase/poly-beta-1,6-N-acetylglucosamine synthase-like glycosyltransferase
MVVSCIVLTVFSVLVTLIWISRHIMIYRQQQSGQMLGPNSPGPGDNLPLVSVMVAAKDEEACIERCVRSMLDQDYPNFEMIVCNDRTSLRAGIRPVNRRVDMHDRRGLPPDVQPDTLSGGATRTR